MSDILQDIPFTRLRTQQQTGGGKRSENMFNGLMLVSKPVIKRLVNFHTVKLIKLYTYSLICSNDEFIYRKRAGSSYLMGDYFFLPVPLCYSFLFGFFTFLCFTPG